MINRAARAVLDEWPELPLWQDLLDDDKAKASALFDALDRLSSIVEEDALRDFRSNGDKGILHRVWWRAVLLLEEVAEAWLAEQGGAID